MTSRGQQLQVRGAALWSRREWVRDQHGEAGVRSMLDELSPAGRNLIHNDIDRTAWYNYPLFINFGTVLDRRFGAGDGRLNFELGRYGCHLNMPTIFSMFIRLGSVEWVLQRAAKVWREHFTAGSLEAHALPEGGAAEAEI